MAIRSLIGVFGVGAAYAIYLACLSPHVAQEFSTAADILTAFVFGAGMALVIPTARLRVMVVALMALGLLWMWPGETDPGKPQLTMIGIGMLTAVAMIGAFVVDWIRRRWKAHDSHKM